MRRSHIALIAVCLVLAPQAAHTQENFAEWPLLTSTFPSTGGAGYIIKGYDPVVSGGKCITTFMATLPPDELYLHVAEYDAVPERAARSVPTGASARSTEEHPERRRSGCSSRMVCSAARRRPRSRTHAKARSYSSPSTMRRSRSTPPSSAFSAAW
jgi:hypothetical protein